MSRELRYWDANAFLAHLLGEAERVEACEAVLEQAEQGRLLIVTSALTLAEVLALRGKEKLPADPAIRKTVVDFFKNEFIAVQNVTRQVAELARDLVWDHGITPKDAVHVASALTVEAPILETFDRDLIRKSGTIGASPPLIIREPPKPAQGKLRL